MFELSWQNCAAQCWCMQRSCQLQKGNHITHLHLAWALLLARIVPTFWYTPCIARELARDLHRPALGMGFAWRKSCGKFCVAWVLHGLPGPCIPGKSCVSSEKIALDKQRLRMIHGFEPMSSAKIAYFSCQAQSLPCQCCHSRANFAPRAQKIGPAIANWADWHGNCAPCVTFFALGPFRPTCRIFLQFVHRGWHGFCVLRWS